MTKKNNVYLFVALAPTLTIGTSVDQRPRCSSFFLAVLLLFFRCPLEADLSATAAPGQLNQRHRRHRTYLMPVYRSCGLSRISNGHLLELCPPVLIFPRRRRHNGSGTNLMENCWKGLGLAEGAPRGRYWAQVYLGIDWCSSNPEWRNQF